jgi:DNA-directed RNA polymerase subunit RPC12/RpoP
MTNKSKLCVICKKNTTNTFLYDYPICSACESQIALMADETIKKHFSHNPSFENEAKFKLDYLEKDYIRKKIKLLHILDRLKYLKK